jgi:cell wall-associated NlpC family hydrolase
MATAVTKRAFERTLSRLVWTAALAAITTACASTGATPRPFPTPGGHPPPAQPGAPGALPGSPNAAATTAPPGFDGYALVGTALSLRGSPYRDGGTDPTGFDCSGFTQYVFAQYGIALPRNVREQYRAGTSVKPEDLEAGDLVFFTTTDPGVSHVGIAVGGDEFVHAPSSTGVVRVERLSSRYWADRYLAAKRVDH